MENIPNTETIKQEVILKKLNTLIQTYAKSMGKEHLLESRHFLTRDDNISIPIAFPIRMNLLKDVEGDTVYDFILKCVKNIMIDKYLSKEDITSLNNIWKNAKRNIKANEKVKSNTVHNNLHRPDLKPVATGNIYLPIIDKHTKPQPLAVSGSVNIDKNTFTENYQRYLDEYVYEIEKEKKKTVYGLVGIKFNSMASYIVKTFNDIKKFLFYERVENNK